jgi:hypothetical protein
MAQDREEDRALPASHTPGPWSQYANGDQIYGGNGYFICVVQSANPYWDARLIAAAPELLEALRYVVCQLADGDEPELDGDGDEIDPFERARAAIAKATGEA